MTYRETLQAVDTLKALKIVGIDGGQQGAYVYFPCTGCRLLSLVAKGYGYKGKVIGQYIRKDPAVITRDLKEKEQLEKEMERVVDVIRGRRAHVNNQV